MSSRTLPRERPFFPLTDEYNANLNRGELAYWRAHDAAMTRPALGWPSAQLDMAHRLSANRARRHGAVDTTNVEHINRLFHMHRRIEESYSLAERRKDPNDATLYPVFKKHSAVVRGVLHGELSSCVPKGVTPRFGPVVRRRSDGDGYSGWSVIKSHTDAMMELAPRDLTGNSERRKYDRFRRAIMADILESRMYRESELRRLFRHYLKKVPVADKEVMETLVDHLCDEFDVVR